MLASALHIRNALLYLQSLKRKRFYILIQFLSLAEDVT